MGNSLQSLLILLFAAVLVVILFRTLKLPAMIGYLLLGVVIGPYGLGLIPDTENTHDLAAFGVVFLMFSIGLEFSLGKLATMRRIVFGLGASQVILTLAIVIGFTVFDGGDWRVGIILGGTVAMSSTAIVSKMLADKLELSTLHGRQVIGVLLFQDLAVVPLLILIPALAQPPAVLAAELTRALIKAAVVLAILLYLGQKPMRMWFNLIARQKSSELFVLNVLLITLGLAFVTKTAGLSLALGAFVAGMLISETEYRYQVEDDIKPFRDVLLGLFFVTVGMQLNAALVAANWLWVAAALLILIALKVGLMTVLARLFGSHPAAALRTALDLAQGGEFGFVLLTLAAPLNLVPELLLQVVLAAMVLSMLISPFLIEHSERLVRHMSGADWLVRAMELTQIATQSMAADRHVIICGYGRSGQNLGRLLGREGIGFVALDIDPQRIKEAATAGERVVYGDAGRREVLVAAGLPRARALIVSVADTAFALRVLAAVQQARPELPVIVRTIDDSDIERLRQAGAAEVVADILEGSLMLASHALMLLGVPLNRVLAHIRQARESRYALFKGFFRGVTDESEMSARLAPRLHSVMIESGAATIGRSLAQIGLGAIGVEVKSLRRQGAAPITPEPDTVVQAGDVLVLLGVEENLAAAEIKLLQG
jgi:CPA2 family monovalent cation:H+ antiporter-2